jgi:hypothetical protein
MGLLIPPRVRSGRVVDWRLDNLKLDASKWKVNAQGHFANAVLGDPDK